MPAGGHLAPGAICRRSRPVGPTRRSELSDEIEFYAEPGVMTDLDGLDAALAGLPTDPAAIAETVQGLLVHPFWAHAYGVDVPPERGNDLRTRPASGMIDRILEIDPRPLVEPREPGRRFVGNCRHFSTLSVALLRRAHVPSRARCGFGNYFEPGKWIDHWIVEYWDGTRWVTLDAQLDALQREALAFAADPTDMPSGMFLPAGAAWLRCRAGRRTRRSLRHPRHVGTVVHHRQRREGSRRAQQGGDASLRRLGRPRDRRAAGRGRVRRRSRRAHRFRRSSRDPGAL